LRLAKLCSEHLKKQNIDTAQKIVDLNRLTLHLTETLPRIQSPERAIRTTTACEATVDWVGSNGIVAPIEIVAGGAGPPAQSYS